MATITYNSKTMTIFGKLAFNGSDRELVISGDFLEPATGVTTAIETLRAVDKTLTVTVGNWTGTYSIATNSVTIAGNVSKAGTTVDSTVKLLRFEGRVTLDTTFADGFRQWFVTIDADERGLETLTINGEVTGAGGAAITTFEAGIGSIEAIAFALSDVEFWNEPSLVFDGIDRNTNSMRFTKRWLQRFEEYNTSDAYDPTIVLSQWSMERVSSNLRTMPLQGSAPNPVTQYRCSWTAKFPDGKTNMISQYDGTIRAMVQARIISIFGASGTFIIDNDAIRYSPTGQDATGNWTVTTASGIVEYSEEVSIEAVFADFEKVLDGNDYTISAFSAGAVGTVTQSVTIDSWNNSPSTPPSPSISGASLILLRPNPRYSRVTRGVPGNSVVVNRLVYEAVFAISKPISDSAASGQTTQSTSATQAHVVGTSQAGGA